MPTMKPGVGTRKPYGGQTRSLVLALDVGTTFSGVSYAILEPGEVPKIHGVTRFPGQEHVAGNSKIPSIIYYDQHGNMKAAGAEADGASVLAQAEDEGWTKIELFKLRMRPKTMSLKMNGMRLSPLPPGKSAVDVFGDFLSYLWRCTSSFIVDTHANGHALWRAVEHDIQFVLSHPNGWEGAQQTKMRRAAVIGGLIPDTDEGKARIRFVTEGEASLHACVLNGLAADVLSNPSGHGFLVADAGGGTLDISSYAIRGTSPLVIEEIAPPDCVFAGSVFVSRRARGFFAEKLRSSKYGTPDSLDHIAKRFDETTKRLFRDRAELQFVPFGSPLDKDLGVGIRGGQLRLTGDEVAALFEPSVESAIASIRSQIQASSGQVKSVWLVGGFAASPWLFSQLQERLSPLGVSVSRPDSQTSKAVADGAIGFYCDHHVSARVSKFMYGVEFLRTFDPDDEDHLSRKHRLFELPSGPKLLPDAFDCILARGVRVKESTVFSRKYCTEVTNLSTLSVFEVEIWCFRGGDEVPKWILRGAEHFSTLCYVRADLSPLAGSAQSKEGTGGKQYWTIVFSIEIQFGLTEFRARIKWVDHDKHVKYGPASIVYNESGTRAEEEDDFPDDDGTIPYTASRSASGQPSTRSSRTHSRSTSRAASVPQSVKTVNVDLPSVASRSSSHRNSSHSSSSSRSPELDRHHTSHSRGVDLESVPESRRSSTISDKVRSRDRSSVPSAAATPRPERMSERDRSVNLSTESRMSTATARLGETLTSIWGTPSIAPSIAPSVRETPLGSPRGAAASFFESAPGGHDLDYVSLPPASKMATPGAASKVASPPLASGVATPTPRSIDPEGLFDPDASAQIQAAMSRAASKVPTAASSKAPTAVPSKAPSKAPTAAPSKAPTAAQSKAPTAAPSKAPTAAPSKAPSVAPSKAPSVAPSKAPSVAPSKAPSVAPSKAPSVAPSKAPSVAPSKAPSKAPSPIPTPKVATPAETPRAANTPGATTPRASLEPPAGVSKAPSPVPTPKQPEAPLPTESKVPTPAASKAPSKAPTPRASKAPTPTAVSKAPSKAPSMAPSKAPSPRPEAAELPEPVPAVEAPPPAPELPRDPNDDSVVPPMPEEPLVAPIDTGAPEPADAWGFDASATKSATEHGLDDLWEGEGKAPGFSDFLTSGNNWSKTASATSTSKRNSAFGAAGAGSGWGVGGWGAQANEWGATAMNAAKSAKEAASSGGWGLGSLTNSFGLNLGGGEDAPSGVASPGPDPIPGGFELEKVKPRELHVDLPPATSEPKSTGPSTPATPGGSKRQKRAAKKAEEDAAAAAVQQAQDKADAEALAAKEAEEAAAAEAAKQAEAEAAAKAADEAASQAAAEPEAAPPAAPEQAEVAPAAEEPASAEAAPPAEEAAPPAPEPAAPEPDAVAEPEAAAAASEAAEVPEEGAAAPVEEAVTEAPAEPPSAEVATSAEEPAKAEENADDDAGGDAEGEDDAGDKTEAEEGAQGKKKKGKANAQDMSRTTSNASGGGGKGKGKAKNKSKKK